MTHEPCVLDDYVSPTLQKLRDMDVGVTTHGINLDTAVIESLRCIVDEVPDVIDEEDGVTNTESATALADQWGYTACAYGNANSDDDGEKTMKPSTTASTTTSTTSTTAATTAKDMDIIYLFDTSNGVSFDNFKDQIEFA